LRIFPTFTERFREISDRWATHLDLHVMPGRRWTVALIDFDCLDVAEMTLVVVSTVAEIDATEESNVTASLWAVANDNEFLVMAPSATNAFVDEDLPAGTVDRFRQTKIVLLAETECVRVRSPDQAPDVHVTLSETAQDGGHVRAWTVELFVRIAAPVREQHQISRLRLVQHCEEAGEVRFAVRQRDNEVSHGPRRPVMAPINLRRRIVPFRSG